MSAPVLLDLTHTSHTRARTGIQRVTRSLFAALGTRAAAITHDPHLRAWRPLHTWEKNHLTSDGAAAHRGAHWPLTAKLQGRAARLFSRRSSPTSRLPKSHHGLIVPEVFSHAVAAALPALLEATHGPRVALFHDAIALKFPELTPAKTVARFPSYLQELLAFDGIAAVSSDSRESLVDYWAWLGVRDTPPVVALPLGIDPPHRPKAAKAPAHEPHRGAQASHANLPVVLSVGSIEGRKNHLALLEACERIWQTGTKFALHLIGLAHPQTGKAALARIRELQQAGRPISYHGPVSDATLEDAYADCVLTVYPSLIEGFGLPVIESLARGKPCICSAHGALGESARGGGCITLPKVDPASLHAALAHLLASPAELAALSAAARIRKFATWADYAAGLQQWMHGLRRRS